jgi:heme A synthase
MCEYALKPVAKLRRLALTTDIVAFAVVLLGSWTRINAAGMTCPRWPLCHHSLVPNLSGHIIWEWTHRLLAFVLLPLVVAVAVNVWKSRRSSLLLAPTGFVVVVLFFTQVGLGAVTVDFDNTPLSVVLHWGTAMMLVASLLALAIFADERTGGAASWSRKNVTLQESVLFATVLATFATMCIGAYVSSSGAGLACLSIPGCAGNVVVYTQGQFVQMLHRTAAAATLLLAVASFALVWVRIASARVRIAASLGLGLVLIQVFLGLLNVALRLPTDLRELHAGNAALVFLSFVSAALFALLDERARVAVATGRES